MAGNYREYLQEEHDRTFAKFVEARTRAVNAIRNMESPDGTDASGIQVMLGMTVGISARLAAIREMMEAYDRFQGE